MGISLYTTVGATCGQFTCGQATCGNASGNAYALPLGVHLLINTLGTASKFRVEERVLTDGGRADGNNFMSRDIEVVGGFTASTLAAQQAIENAIRQQAYTADQKLQIDSGAYINVARCKQCDFNYLEVTGRMYTDMDAIWTATDPYFYGTATLFTVALTTNPQTLTIDTGSSPKFPMYPYILVQGAQYGILSSFTITQQTDSGNNFTCADPILANSNGAQVLIDCVNGGVSRALLGAGAFTNTIQYFSGLFLRLLPGVNTLTISGSGLQWNGGTSGNIWVYWSPRWI